MKLEKSTLTGDKTVQISGSKSISNRLLILESLFSNIKIGNLSNSQDTQLLKKALSANTDVVDIHHAGTAMRFLTSYYSIQEGKTTVLTGSGRMKERPIKNLVSALRDLGVDIEYLENEGFPPLKITGRKITQTQVNVPANISSQFITSLLLIAGKLENGLKINLVGEVTSRSYIEMTLDILTKFGIKSSFEGNTIKVEPYHGDSASSALSYEVESDWSSASYFYSICALGRKTIHLKSFYKESTQGDSAIAKIYEDFFGIKTIFSEDEHKITLQPQPDFSFPEKIVLDMNNCPDIAQTLCVTAAALQIPFDISGLGTLRVKETDRLLALYNELKKLGTETEITDLTIQSTHFGNPQENISIKTYQDHRMAMSFAPFCLIKELNIEDEDVVEKSYPMFWEDLASVVTK
ncbi:3-phosphoshikimate 1-carboxyvinyltransferase [Chryseobacterium rhizosphaerae]|uniref:3-phosphoshikimate 1-carboxyvinyltransferase n=1 Tax=Chryseobacterium rhizosphaerae TaxID=395937 RepID=A0AAE3YEG2_9FLAO|nr:3-phosphoshikimate 1-carboxyvinyltransferase [Chryseobacterium rhizosphaerae]MDC8098273.1 3-phosphoshikimate 1-carboxyvinyltransferase [Chryseobacterium rhizosphaerae]MDR6528967.1 3-phosphoshikimate 1-carboxyvinyltransferase [Chryseobacterium rhizosphaerae]MDR6546795.1 3-phosphoshikimate 1-carboxyvinyltransferase [Chryseobacterium rhizosphaerae]REC78737.1 3-phosphoshikimate 1-carboxyvinyltransferase [Chryseobacterium rhizosphaerae]GEN69634.1 3-phosphoshikimate 1-carboxyvinyltransferase [Chr